MARYPKGVSGNPKGRPKDPPELHRLKTMSYYEFKALLHTMMAMPPEDLMMNQDTVLKATLASILYSARKTGDHSKLDFFIQRLYGKVPDKVEVSEGEKLKELTDLELYELAKEQIKAFEKKLLQAKGNTDGSSRNERTEEE